MIKHVSNKAFTIVEVLIIVLIISILTSITGVYANTIQKQTRDKERNNDTVVIVNSLERYYAANNEYPQNELLNPSFSSSTLPNYSAVKATLPYLTDDNLTGSLGYNFFTPSCDKINCPESAADVLLRPKQYIYFSWRDNVPADVPPAHRLRYFSADGMWGCQVDTAIGDSGYVLAWRNEETGLWTFKKSRSGGITISNFGGGPIAPQTCTFS